MMKINSNLSKNNNVTIKNNSINKLCLIFAFSTLTYLSLFVWNHPATNYEISIYSSTPFIFWLIVYFIMIISIIIIIYNIGFHEICLPKIHLIWLLVFFLSYSIICSLYVIRGYYMWNIEGDVGSHIKYINEIMQTGYINENLMYPYIHLLSVIFLYIFNSNIIFIHKILPVIFSLLFPIFMFLLSKYIFPRKSKNHVFVFLISCSFLIGNLSLAPFKFSTLIFPMFLTVYFANLRNSKWEWRILLLICIFLSIVFHLIAGFTYGLLIATTCALSFISVKKFNSIALHSLNDLNISFTQIIFLIVCFFTWALQFLYIQWTINDMYTTLIQSGIDEYNVISESINNAIYVGNNPIIEIFKRYGLNIWVLLISFVSTILFIKKDYTSKENSILFVTYASFFSVIAFMIFIVMSMGFTMASRWLSYTQIIGAILCSYLFVYIISSSKNKKNEYYLIKKLLTIFLLCGILTLGIISFYPSPFNGQASYHTTKQSVDAMKWFFNYRNVENPLIGISIAPGRYADYLLNKDERANQQKEHYLMNYMYSVQDLELLISDHHLDLDIMKIYN